MATTARNLVTTRTTLPPGPRKLPYIGNMLSLRRNPLGYIQQLQRTYGNMATIHVGRTPMVLLFRPEHMRYVLVEHPGNFSNQGVLQGGGNATSEGLLTIDGEKHRQQRRAVQPAFHKKRVESYASIIEQYVQELLETWHPGDRVDMSQAMQKLTLRIVSKCLFSIDLSTQLDALSGAFNNMIGSSTSVAEDLLNIHIDNPITGYGKRMAATRQLDMLIYTLIAQRHEEQSEYNDVLSMLLTAQSGEQPATNLNDKQIHDHVLTFIAAGHETTANALVWTLYLLAEHPYIREKLLDEVRTVLAGRKPSLDNLAQLPYTDWVLSESMRLYPPAWMQARFVAKDFELDGVHLPVGTLIMLSQWVIHRLPDIWEQPEVFRPERWSPENAGKIPPGAYFPFGGGPRICIGMPFAQLEAKLILVALLQRYTPQPVPGYKPGLKPAITLRPEHNLRVTLLPTATSSTSADQWQQVLRVSDTHVSVGAERKGCRDAILSLFGLA